jgi:uncharacterized membrane protein YphA (DoxX/SURF4 family)
MTKSRFFKGTDHLKPLSLPARVVAAVAGSLFLTGAIVALAFGAWLKAWIAGLFAAFCLVSAWKGKDYWDNPPSRRKKQREGYW